MRKLPVFFIILILSLLLVGLIYAGLNGFFTIPTSGTIRAINLECDTSIIDWGILEPTEQKTVTVNVRASGNVPVVLSINAQNWQPADAPQHLTFSHDYQNQTVTETWFPVALTLAVDVDVEGFDQFSFDIVIVGSET